MKKGFQEAQNRLAGLTALDEKSLKPALREVRLSLLEADVELGVVKRFLADVEADALAITRAASAQKPGLGARLTARLKAMKAAGQKKKGAL